MSHDGGHFDHLVMLAVAERILAVALKAMAARGLDPRIVVMALRRAADEAEMKT